MYWIRGSYLGTPKISAVDSKAHLVVVLMGLSKRSYLHEAFHIAKSRHLDHQAASLRALAGAPYCFLASTR
jgi:hypothetical protein